ncbi:cyclase/dehydrase [Allomeiothermus silvanus DSM 9946]|uniref:Cyclase/dehydrase n=1 Tax=Allomeiothermus silvanus (strain ATCC 700542 / DSM 9946 / NBRC 106475 / NCIMB 13440 / VI-R2) TaxID=526227 RepID=D7BEG1_ALLS1|nr:SRPBCC family protein [Allomeiothermus silvanus]ADH63204.1 cyclase/dehydrase [Allomeiothermus silvanus DSM 9946]
MYKAEASIRVPADQQQVWEYISKYENFDQFMSHVEEVEMEDSRISAWRLRGPLGIPVTWKAVTTVMNPARELAWQSVEGSIKTQGHIRVEPEGDQTRIEVCVEYVPPGGAVGEAFASLFKNPQKMLEHDLENLREIIASWPAHEPARPGPAVDSVADSSETDELAPPTTSSTPNPLESELVKKKTAEGYPDP